MNRYQIFNFINTVSYHPFCKSWKLYIRSLLFLAYVYQRSLCAQRYHQHEPLPTRNQTVVILILQIHISAMCGDSELIYTSLVSGYTMFYITLRLSNILSPTNPKIGLFLTR